MPDLSRPPAPEPRIAVLIPCFNEEVAVGGVVAAFRRALPHGAIYVYDNDSTDATARQARQAGAIVRHEPMRGKGHVVRRMFRDIEADYYVLVDGDQTYDAEIAPGMIALARNGPHDLVNCVREASGDACWRGGHRLGNTLLTATVRQLFGNRVQDMLSGYKVLSRRFVKSFPALSGGFDIETELTVHALELAMPIAHLRGRYLNRPQGSVSKLRTWSDGLRILATIARLLRHERPLLFFGSLAGLLAATAVALALPLLPVYLATGLVPRLPTAVLATGMMLLAALSLLSGLILDTVSRGRREVRLLAYLQYASFATGPNPQEPCSREAAS